MAPVQPEIVPLAKMDDAALAAIAFGFAAPGALLSVDVPQLGDVPLVEVWRSVTPVRRTERDGIALAANGDVIVGALACDSADAHRAAACVYDRLIGVARAEGYPHVQRVWNHVRDINRIVRGLERYRAFSAGRHEAFAKHGYAMRGAGLVFVSGTASVVGHETKHVGDVARQLDETLVNLDAIVRAAGASEMLIAKVYVRRRDDYALIAARLREAMPRTQTMFLHAELCRADLLVEIDGVAALSPRA